MQAVIGGESEKVVVASTEPEGRRSSVVPGLESFGSDGLSAVFDATPDSILIVDEHGGIEAINAAAEQSFGYAAGELVGQSVTVLMLPHDQAHHDGYMRAYGATGHPTVIGLGREVYGRRRDGSQFPLHLSIGEFDHLGRRYFVGVGHDVTEQRERQQEVSRLATYDDLTGALNRATAVTSLHERLSRAAAQDDAVAVLFIDLNHFKQINDRFGHAVGDEVLRVMAHRFAAQIRGYDLLARVGGDEFLAVVQTDGNPDVAQRIAERLSSAAQAPVAIERQLLSLSANIGISLFPTDGTDADELIGNADIAMYEAKRAGETEPRRFSADLRDERVRQFDLRRRVTEALDRHELVLHYDPQVDMETGEVVGLKALVRWQDPTYGVRHGADFLPAMEAAGLYPRFTRYVLDLACRENAALIASGDLDVPVAVGVFPSCFTSRGFVPHVEEALAAHGLAADRLEIELTETGPTAALATAQAHAQALYGLGVGIAMDDFGTGFSSIARLREHRFSTLKIDRTFITSVPGTDQDTALITGMLAIARGLQMRTIAEGVETEEQRDYLLAAGCRIAQGPLYAPSMPMTELRGWLRAAVPEPRRAEPRRTGV